MKKPNDFEEMHLIHFDLTDYVSEIYTVILNDCPPSAMRDWLKEAFLNKQHISFVINEEKEALLRTGSGDLFTVTAKNYTEEDWVSYMYDIGLSTDIDANETVFESTNEVQKGKDFINMIRQDFGIIDKNCKKCDHLLSFLSPEMEYHLNAFRLKSGKIYLCTNEECVNFDFSEAEFEPLSDKYLQSHVLEPGDLKVLSGHKELARKKLKDDILYEKTACFSCNSGTLKINSVYAYTSFGEKKYKAVMECDFCHAPVLLID